MSICSSDISRQGVKSPGMSLMCCGDGAMPNSTRTPVGREQKRLARFNKVMHEAGLTSIAIPPPPPRIIAISPSPPRVCPYCGQRASPESLSCRFCGGRLEG